MDDETYTALLYDLKPVDLFKALTAMANALSTSHNPITNWQLEKALRAGAQSLIRPETAR